MNQMNMIEIATNYEIITYIFIFTIICRKTKTKKFYGLKPEVCRGEERAGEPYVGCV